MLRASVTSKASLEGASELGAVASTNVLDLGASLQLLNLGGSSGRGGGQESEGEDDELSRLEKHVDVEVEGVSRSWKCLSVSR